jgi:NAD-dependent dihydropyrimidine dehydrogenase PreA subunit
MKALYAYYTGTGNTRRALVKAAEGLAAAGWKAEWLEIRAGGPSLGAALEGLRERDLLVLGFPALGFSAPQLVLRTLRSLPRMPGIRAAVLCACGATAVKGRVAKGWSGTAVPEVLRILARKGAVPVGSAEASYPENWTQVSSPGEGADLEAMTNLGDGQAREFGGRLAEALAAGGPASRGLPAGSVRRGPVSRFLGPVLARVFRNLGRRFLARLFIADGSCTSCGLCARSCPAGAIRMIRGRPEWTTACSACNRCINLCPSRSIQTSTLRVALVLGVNAAFLMLAAPAARHLAAVLGTTRIPGSGVVVFLLWLSLCWAFSLLQTGPLDGILRALERNPALRQAFQRGFTRSFKRYLAPGFRPGMGD